MQRPRGTIFPEIVKTKSLHVRARNDCCVCVALAEMQLTLVENLFDLFSQCPFGSRVVVDRNF